MTRGEARPTAKEELKKALDEAWIRYLEADDEYDEAFEAYDDEPEEE